MLEWAVLVQWDGSNRHMIPLLHGDIALSIIQSGGIYLWLSPLDDFAFVIFFWQNLQVIDYSSL